MERTRPLWGVVAAVALVAACRGGNASEEIVETKTPGQGANSESPKPSPTEKVQTIDPTETPAATIERLQPFIKIPDVPEEFRGSTQTIYDYLMTQRLIGSRLRLVENEQYDLDVKRSGTLATDLSYGLVATIKSPGTVQEANDGRVQVCKDVLEAAGPIGAELSIQFGVVVPNAGANPTGEIGFTPQEAGVFMEETTCGVVTA